MDETLIPLDLNTASREELKIFLGVNNAVADRILSARPFSSVDELGQVKGIGPAKFERMRQRVIVSGTPKTEDELSPSTVEADLLAEVVVPPDRPAGTETQGAVDACGEAFPLPGDESQPASDQPPLVESPPLPETAPSETTPAPQSPVRYIPYSEAFVMSVGSGVLAFMLAVCFTLGCLLLLNGSLRFARPADVRALSGRIDALEMQATVIQQGIADLSTRVGSLQDQSDRLAALEDTSETLATQLEVITTQLDSLNLQMDTLVVQSASLDQRVDDVALQVDALITRSGRFQEFLDGLRSLLDTVAQP